LVLRDHSQETVLLIAAPVTFPDFLSRVINSDWLSKFNDCELNDEERRERLTERWVSEYSVHVAEPLQDLMRTASELRVEVRTEATLDTLREVVGVHKVVILFAHWKGPEIVGDDFVVPVDLSEFARRVEADKTLLGKWLRPRLARLYIGGGASGARHGFWGWFRPEPPRPTIRDLLSEAALVRLADDDSLISDRVDCVMEAEVTRLARRRDELDHLFGGLLRPGNRLELFDGLHSKEKVLGALSDDFEGIIDLTTCTSTILSDFIGQQRRQRVRTVQFPFVQEPRWASQCIELTLRLFVEQNVPYQESRALATALMEHAVGEKRQAWSERGKI
jgi:hypothetical protein